MLMSSGIEVSGGGRERKRGLLVSGRGGGGVKR